MCRAGLSHLSTGRINEIVIDSTGWFLVHYLSSDGSETPASRVRSMDRSCFALEPSEGLSINKDFRVNEQILRGPRDARVRDVRVIDDNNEALGIMPVRDALTLAQERGLDLIEVAPTAQ